MRNATITDGGEAGFTLTEILVVILIVGVLAAIAIPSLLGQRDRGRDAEAKTAVGAVARAMAVYSEGHDDSYACGSSLQCLATLRDIEEAIPGTGVAFSAAGGSSGDPTANGYRVTVTGGDGRTFWLDTTSSATSHGCDLNGARSNGGCNSAGGAPGTW
jgi:type IV pilus assembly protein PilA